jgi:DNA-binding NarL/FixJ family response regulator
MLQRKIATYISPKTSREVANSVCSQLPLDLHALNYVEELYALLSDPTYHTDFVVISIETFHNRADGLDMFDIIGTLATLIKGTVYRPRPSAKPRHRDTKIIVLVDHNTDLQLIKELLTFPHVASIGWVAATAEDYVFALEHTNRLLAGNFGHDQRVIKRLSTKRPSKAGTKNKITLTTRQYQVLKLIQDRGCSNKHIAKILNISESTVKLHVGAILKKYGVKTRTQLAVFANKQD